VAQTEVISKPASVRVLPGALVAALAVLVFVSWLLSTPPGLLGKADAIGYAICHRIDLRSYHLGDRQLPLCARCTGIYLGALLGMVSMGVMGRSRAGALPRRAILLVLLGFIGLMGVDGVNSYLTLFPGAPHLYEPQNWLRMTTGTLNGLALGSLTLPILNQTLWKDWEARPGLASFRELGVLLVCVAGVIALVSSESLVALYPLALLSALGVVALLTALNTTLVLFATRRVNCVEDWRGAVPPLLAGFTLAMLQIGLVDAMRFALFGTWGGLVIPA
jgi:uncharacterized membrane protein